MVSSEWGTIVARCRRRPPGLDDLPADALTEGKRALVRVDFNVPLERGEGGTPPRVADDLRLRAALPTVERITQAGAKAVLMSHLGRPGGTPAPALSLRPVAKRFEELLGRPVHFCEETTGEEPEAVIEQLTGGSVVLLENTRFAPGEKSNDDDFAEALAALGDVFVGDAFGAAHRAHASTVGAARAMQRAGRPAAMGRLVERELEALGRLVEEPESPFVAVLGGAKVSDKLGVIERLLGVADRLLIGGAMSYTFMQAQGRPAGDSPVEDDRVADAERLLSEAGDRLLLPSDHLAAEGLDEGADYRPVEGSIPAGQMGVDIGPQTATRYQEAIRRAQTVAWNGPMGVVEQARFAEGTRAVAEAVKEATDDGAYTVAGGGDSAAALSEMGFADAVRHLSTGGGAMLQDR
ncbi:MAG: phosphoglycerate kinase [Bacteroidetes bacterium QS_9_68_14]|nr:MAG: phosphoglycerate kinase [Bacteroidetes bacterium QS_9_68_14]